MNIPSKVSFPAAKLSFGIPAWTAGSFLRTAGAQRPIAEEGTAELEHDLPVNFSVGADHTDPAAIRVTLIIDYGFGCIANFAIGRRCSGGGSVVLRNITIR